MGALGAREKRKFGATFAKFKKLFLAKHGEHGTQLFQMYQRVARQILARVSTQPQQAAIVRRRLHDVFVRETHKHITAKNVDAAVKNLITVVTDLARQVGVKLPAGGGRFVPIGMATGGAVPTGRDVTSASSPSPITAADRAKSGGLLAFRSASPGDKTGFQVYDSNQRPVPWPNPLGLNMNRPR